MRIDGSSSSNIIAPHIARAYGVPQSRPAASITPASSTAPTSPPSATAPLARIGGATAAQASKATAQSLIAGRVPGAIEFDGVSVPRMNPSNFSLYTRAADKIEAATAVQIGRTIDIKG